MDKENFEEATKKCLDDGLIKVHFTLKDQSGPAGESVWATPIGKKYAKINNIPFFVDNVSINDIVEIKTNSDSYIKEFVNLVSRGSRKSLASYHIGENHEETVSNFTDLRDYIVAQNCMIEGASPGFCVVAFPVETTKAKAKKILSKAPHIKDFS